MVLTMTTVPDNGNVVVVRGKYPVGTIVQMLATSLSVTDDTIVQMITDGRDVVVGDRLYRLFHINHLCL